MENLGEIDTIWHQTKILLDYGLSDGYFCIRSIGGKRMDKKDNLTNILIVILAVIAFRFYNHGGNHHFFDRFISNVQYLINGESVNNSPQRGSLQYRIDKENQENQENQEMENTMKMFK
ncbi:hypothetical protein MTBLM1_190005 [Rhodospirillaceae bacterium LM-1]|nr:hypothetical protein MTBLM1_190005 [Rhodospirillaceae bacterium LM-1]